MKIKTKIKPHFEKIKDIGTAYTWRNERGIVNVIFWLDNSITWASYLEEGEQKNKGKFYADDKVPDGLIEAINKLQE